MAGSEKGFATPVGSNQVLVGKWKNELGSVMIIDRPFNDMSFKGTYETKVGADVIKNVPLFGFMNPTHAEIPTFTFGISWDMIKAGSCSAFVGQYFNTEKGEELCTKWLLREPEPKVEDDWEATLVGKDIFKRV